MVRTVAVVAGVFLVALLGAVQLASSAAYGDLAARPSLPALLHDHAPALLRPLLGGTRAQAAAAVHRGDLATARRLADELPEDARTDDLRGRIVEGYGDRLSAIAQYVRAGDVVRAQALIDAIAATNPDHALTLQATLVGALKNDPSAGEVIGEAWWRLGQLQAAAGYHVPAERAARWRDAETSYEHALALAPNEETYLLAAGYQSLANGDVAGSARRYAHAAEVVPDSADAYAGLAWTAALNHDCAHARENLARARALRATTAPAAGATAPRDPVDDPLAGPALKRCAA